MNKSAEVIVLDDKITAGTWEHELPIPGKKYKNYVPCIGGMPGQSCPICAAGNQRQYIMFLSVLDLSEYTNEQGKTYGRQKKLLPLKPNDKKAWVDAQNQAIQAHGTMRGMYVYLERPNVERSPRIGYITPVQGRSWQHFTEAELVKAYGHPVRIGDDKKVKAEANYDITVMNYDKVLPFPTEELIAGLHRQYGNGIPEHSNEQSYVKEDVGQTVGGTDDIDEAWNDEIEDGGEVAEEAEAPEGHEGWGAVADEGDQDAASHLTALAEQLELSTDDYGSWADVEAAIDAAVNPPKPKVVAKKAAVKFAAKKVAAKVATKFAVKKVAVKKVAFKTAPAKPGGVTRPNRSSFND